MLPSSSSTDNADESIRQNLLDTSEKGILPQVPPPHSGLNLKSTLKIALVLFLTIFYLTFCVVVRYRNIPIGGSGVLLPFARFSTQSGITTIAILIVYVALWPINGLVDEIRSEEFFRLLHTHPNGVPLDSVNVVSNPTTGAFDIFLATIYRRCSLFLTSTLAITLLITATASLAPAALNTHSILIDQDNSTFRVGAVPNGSVYIMYPDLTRMTFGNHVQQHLPQASSMYWVENTLNFTNAYHTVENSEDDPFKYVVPFPPEYTAVSQGSWTTDIIAIDPSCSWQTVNIPIYVGEYTTLLPSNLKVTVTNDSFVSGYRMTAKASVLVPAKMDSPITFNIIPFDGSVVFAISRLSDTRSSANLSTVPTHRSSGNDLAFLVCDPRASIQTRRVRTTGIGTLTLGSIQKNRGNLDLDQVNGLLSNVLGSFATSSGPTQPQSFDVGTDVMVKLLFGDHFDIWGNNPPAPLSNITVVYKQIIQSAMKSLMSGAIDTRIVPGGFVKEQLVFTSSLGHVITSAILFALITMALVAAQFRTGRDAFTLVDVAAVLADSDAPQKCVEMKQWVGARERKVLRLVPSGDGGLVCIYENFESSTSDVDEARRGEGK